jgi:hypothetical protein
MHDGGLLLAQISPQFDVEHSTNRLIFRHQYLYVHWKCYTVTSRRLSAHANFVLRSEIRELRYLQKC